MTNTTRLNHAGNATLVTRSAVFGVRRVEVREVRVELVEPYGHYARAARAVYKLPRKRVSNNFVACPDNEFYFTVEVGGREVYDSRADVPCDMAKWEQTSQKCNPGQARDIERKP